MNKNTRTKTEVHLRAMASQIRLAQYWSSTAFSISFICLYLFIWSNNLIPMNFLFLVDKNKSIIFWVSLLLGIVSLIFAIVTFLGARYAKSEMIDVLGKLEKKAK